MTTEEEDAAVCSGALTFQSEHCKTLVQTLLHPLTLLPLPSALWCSFSCSLHLLCVLLFLTRFLSLYISLLILIPLFFLRLSLSLISLTLTPRCPHTPPLSLPYMGARPILPLSLALSLPTADAPLPPSPYLSSHPCFPSVWLEKLLWIIDW